MGFGFKPIRNCLPSSVLLMKTLARRVDFPKSVALERRSMTVEERWRGPCQTWTGKERSSMSDRLDGHRSDLYPQLLVREFVVVDGAWRGEPEGFQIEPDTR